MRGEEARGAAGRGERRHGWTLAEGVPAELWHDFMMYRLLRGAGARVSAELRERVLEALERGVPLRALRRELGLRAEQVARWQRQKPRGEVATAAGALATSRDVRVFEVAEEVLEPGARVGATERDEGVEVRLGGWSIVVRRCAAEER